MKLLAKRLEAPQVVAAIELCRDAMLPEFSSYKLPADRRVREINLAMLQMTIMECTSMFAVHDLMNDDQQEFGSCVMLCKMGDETMKQVLS